MDISGVSIPVSHEIQQEPPRNAQLVSAVSEPPPAEQSGNDTQSESDASHRDPDSSLGRHVDERA